MTLKPFNPEQRDAAFSNGERAARAARIMSTYKHEELGESGPATEQDVGDLLPDILHWLHSQGSNAVGWSPLLDILHSAHNNFVTETNGEE